jgi:hypothetical protein
VARGIVERGLEPFVFVGCCRQKSLSVLCWPVGSPVEPACHSPLPAEDQCAGGVVPWQGAPKQDEVLVAFCEGRVVHSGTQSTIAYRCEPVPVRYNKVRSHLVKESGQYGAPHFGDGRDRLCPA